MFDLIDVPAMSWIGAAIGAASAIAGDMIGSNRQATFNAREAQRNRDWQTDMSNTAIQRAANDAEAAGLNRIIALGNPATSPSGATASIEAPKLGSTGIAAASAQAQIEQNRAQTKLTKALEKTEVQKERLTAAEAAKAELFKAPLEHFSGIANDTAKGIADTIKVAPKYVKQKWEDFKQWSRDSDQKIKDAFTLTKPKTASVKHNQNRNKRGKK